MRNEVQPRPRKAGPIGIAFLLLAGLCLGQTTVSMSPKDGPPTTTLRVSGSGFTPYSQIDIYFDSQDQALVVADATGTFSQFAIQAPKSAVPGNHWVTAAERSGGRVKQEIFKVHVNWTEFLTKDMHRENPYENVLGVDNVGDLNVKWTYPTGGLVYSSPAVVNGVAYFGSNDHNVYAVNIGTGTLLWNYSTGYSVYSSPAVVNGVVYVGSGDGNVYALNAATGEKIWSSSISSVYHSPLAVAKGMVYVCSLEQYEYVAYALDAETGALKRRRKVGGINEGGACSPAVDGGRVYVGGTGISAYATNTGALVWNYPSLVLDSGLAVGNGAVYAGCDDGYVYALDASSGVLLWAFSAAGYLDSTPAVANGVVYIGVHPNGPGDISDVNRHLYALDATTGAQLWSYQTGVGIYSSPTVVNGVVYLGEGYFLYAFGLPHGLSPQPPKRPDPKTLRPDFNLKPVSAND